MNIGILGTGDVGTTLGSALVNAGHQVRMGSRSPSNEKALAWVGRNGARASSGTFGDAAAFGEILILATAGVANEAVISAAGLTHFDGKVLLDVTNPLDFSQGLPRIAFESDSCGERAQRLLPRARVVKFFNSVGHVHMVHPQFPAGPPTMLLAGNDPEAKRIASGFVEGFGWRPVDFGGIDGARYLEAMAVVWIRLGILSGSWNHALTAIHR
jgi:8-hydroxy-5-deazaflavin:NADPH oxidoreductase